MSNPDLYQAAFEGRVEDVKSLIEQGVDLNERGFGGQTALMMAAGPGPSDYYLPGRDRALKDFLDRRTDIAKLLIDNGADLDLKSDTGDTALFLAEREGHHDIARMLRAAHESLGVEHDQRDNPDEQDLTGAYVKAVSEKRISALMAEGRSREEAIVEYLAEEREAVLRWEGNR